MRNRRRIALYSGLILLAVPAISLVLAFPDLVYSALRNDAKLDHFLNQRNMLFTQLEVNTRQLERNFEFEIRPELTRVPPKNEFTPGNAHIQSVVHRGNTWSGDSEITFDVHMRQPLLDKPATEVAFQLHNDLSSGLEALGLNRFEFGGPDFSSHHRAAHTLTWTNADRSLIVTNVVSVDANSHAAHVIQVIHERFE